MRYYIIGTDGNVHGEASTKAGCELLLEDITYKMRTWYGNEYVEELELEIVEGW